MDQIKGDVSISKSKGGIPKMAYKQRVASFNEFTKAPDKFTKGTTAPGTAAVKSKPGDKDYKQLMLEGKVINGVTAKVNEAGEISLHISKDMSRDDIVKWFENADNMKDVYECAEATKEEEKKKKEEEEKKKKSEVKEGEKKKHNEQDLLTEQILLNEAWDLPAMAELLSSAFWTAKVALSSGDAVDFVPRWLAFIAVAGPSMAAGGWLLKMFGQELAGTIGEKIKDLAAKFKGKIKPEDIKKMPEATEEKVKA